MAERFFQDVEKGCQKGGPLSDTTCVLMNRYADCAFADAWLHRCFSIILVRLQ